MKGFIIDCNFLIAAIDYLPEDYRVEEIPIIFIDTGLWEQW